MDVKERANSIIKNHMYLAVGAGLIPVPVVDFVAVTGIQIDMIKKLADLYNVDFQKSQAKAIISALTGAGIARLAAGMTKVIPIIGSILGGITMSGLSGASTYAIGEVFKNHFSSGGNIGDLDIDKFTSFYKDKFEQGKTMAKDMETEQKTTESKTVEFDDAIVDEFKSPEIKINPVSTEDKISKLEQLGKLLEQKIITKTEFKEMKKDLLS